MSESKKVITELSYAGKGWDELPDKVAERCGSTLIKLDLCENTMGSGKGLEGFTVLEELILDKNELTTLKDFPKMASVKTLWLNNNKFTDSETTVSEIANRFPNLVYLSMLFNPCVPNAFLDEAATDSYQRHRYYVISRLRNLQALDSCQITDVERAESNRVGHLMKIAKPKAVARPTPAPTPAPENAEPKPAPQLPNNAPPRAAAFLAKGKPRYDGTNSEGNRFIVNDDL